MKFFTVQDYICSKPAQTQNRLNELRAYLLEVCSGSIDEMKWGKPALTSGGILVVYAAAKHHISLHPTPSVLSYLNDEIGSRLASANTVHFSLLSPIPKMLVQKIATRRIFEKEKLGMKWK